MNKKLIESLAAQSLVYQDTGLADGRELVFSTHKFAQLVVEECIGQVQIEYGNPYRNMGDTDELAASALDESIRRIQEHFGVEE